MTQNNTSLVHKYFDEFANKSARINMRLPEILLERIKNIADKQKIPYTRFIRQILETVVEREEHARSKKIS